MANGAHSSLDNARALFIKVGPVFVTVPGHDEIRNGCLTLSRVRQILATIVDQALIGGIARQVSGAAYSLSIGYAIFQRPRLRSSLVISLIGMLAFLDLLLVGGIERTLIFVRSWWQ